MSGPDGVEMMLRARDATRPPMVGASTIHAAEAPGPAGKTTLFL